MTRRRWLLRLPAVPRISYPTVIKRLDLVNVLLGNQAAPSGRKNILEQLERGEITVQEATQLLKAT